MYINLIEEKHNFINVPSSHSPARGCPGAFLWVTPLQWTPIVLFRMELMINAVDLLQFLINLRLLCIILLELEPAASAICIDR
jgi:hypothetical protein